jgi:hypothetical protein
MENTLSLLLQDIALKWYIVVNSRPIGPLSAKEIVQRVQSKELSLADHIWREGSAGWSRLYEVTDFRSLLPAEPEATIIAEIQKSTQVAPPPLSPKQKEELRTWYVHLDETNYGPISDREVQSLIEAGRIGASTYVWQKGFEDWQQAVSVPAWSKYLASGNVAADLAKSVKVAAVKDKRSAPRKPFEAKILLTDGKEIGWAICRDISIGGMQVLMDHAPAPVGTSLKLNVSTHGKVPGFTCEGTIVRHLEDGRGFSFRFINLSADAKTAIEKYITI